MWNWKEKLNSKKVLAGILAEAVLLTVYSIIVIAGYSAYWPLSFTENDMQLYTAEGGVEEEIIRIPLLKG